MKILLSLENRSNFLKVDKVARSIVPGAIYGNHAEAYELICRCLLAGGTVEVRS